MEKKLTNIIVKQGDKGIAVEDVQSRLASLGYLTKDDIDGSFGPKTAAAVKKFSHDVELPEIEDVSEKLWSKLVDATFKLGDRNLFLRVPYFHGNDVLMLQKALGALGFQIRYYDSIFGPSTEKALRKFQINMGLPSDGIAGSQTFTEIKNLQFTWSDKNPVKDNAGREINVFWRAEDILEKYSICIFGTDEFTRMVATRISNLATATNPYSKILCSEAYSVAPDAETLLLHVALPDEGEEADAGGIRVLYSETDSEDATEEENKAKKDEFVQRLMRAIHVARKNHPYRMAIEVPGKVWRDAGEIRSAQHFAITILDALCNALHNLSKMENA